MFRADFPDDSRIVGEVRLPLVAGGQVRLGVAKLRQPGAFDDCAQIGHALQLVVRRTTQRQFHRVGHDDFFHAGLFCGRNQHEGLRRRTVAGFKHQIVLGNDLKNFREFRHGLPILDHRDKRQILAGLTHLGLAVLGRQPDDFAAVALDLHHPAHGLGVEAAHGTIQHNSTKNLDAADFMHRGLRAIGGGEVMVFQDDGAHAVRLGLADEGKIIEGTLRHVRRGVAMEINDPRQGIGGGRDRGCTQE